MKSDPDLPVDCSLDTAYPSPFNSVTTISFFFWLDRCMLIYPYTISEISSLDDWRIDISNRIII